MASGSPLGDAAAVQVTQVRSGIGTKPKHRGTLRALGLHGIGTTNTLPNRPEIRGMIARVPHLVRVEAAPSEQETPGEEPQ
jgi:large subunit ribosomal protein L30